MIDWFSLVYTPLFSQPFSPFQKNNMGTSICLILAISPSFLIQGVISSATFTLTNNCNQTVWPGILSTGNGPSLNPTGFALQKNESKVLNYTSSWSGRFWGRTRCSEDTNGNFTCETGDCGSGKLECAGAGAAPPATLAEFTVGGSGGNDFFDVSLVDGFNLPMLVVPIGGSRNCSSTGCATDLNAECPSELEVSNSDGEVVACNGPCGTFGAKQFCCSGTYGSSDTCKPTLYSQLFKTACPSAYSYPYDDQSSTFTCTTGANYLVTFCPPSNTSVNTPVQPKNRTEEKKVPGPAPAPEKFPESAPDSWFQRKKRVVIVVTLSISSLLMLLGLILALYVKKKRSDAKRQGGPEKILHKDSKGRNNRMGNLEVPSFSLSKISMATNDFSDDNKLGEGGFGPVYKGVLEGQEIAVKRLSKSSRQGLVEFKNEVICIAKLQHRNLVKLLGYCIQGDEKMLIYEYMPNKSLDSFLFDESRKLLLDWPRRFHIIHGIARGLLYLHQDSRLKVVHRDLKAGNILLDQHMHPKISDFGLARMFEEDESEANTNRVVGTLGYISPEYAVNGLFSVKSDVFSFGVLVLEIVSGKKNRGFVHEDHDDNLLGHAWRLYKEDKSLDLIDDCLRTSCSVDEVLRSIHVGLLCVQHRVEDRPNTPTMVAMLDGQGSLPSPKRPAFFIQEGEISSISVVPSVPSTNEVTLSDVHCR